MISYSDIEEVIKSIQDNQDTITDKVMDFNVDSLLNDPYTLWYITLNITSASLNLIYYHLNTLNITYIIYQ